MQWLDGPDGTLFFTREPGFVFAANTGPAEVTLPPHSKVLLASGPIEDGKLPPDTVAWLAR
jgi:alpha-glucosidase